MGILVSASYCTQESRRVIGVVPKSQAHIFWMAVHAGTLAASNESGTFGAAQAVKSRGVAGKLKVVGFDTSPSLVEDLKAGVIDSLVLQDPFNMGYHALMTLVDSLEGGGGPSEEST